MKHSPDMGEIEIEIEIDNRLLAAETARLSGRQRRSARRA